MNEKNAEQKLEGKGLSINITPFLMILIGLLMGLLKDDVSLTAGLGFGVFGAFIAFLVLWATKR